MWSEWTFLTLNTSYHRWSVDHRWSVATGSSFVAAAGDGNRESSQWPLGSKADDLWAKAAGGCAFWPREPANLSSPCLNISTSAFAWVSSWLPKSRVLWNVFGFKFPVVGLVFKNYTPPAPWERWGACGLSKKLLVVSPYVKKAWYVKWKWGEGYFIWNHFFPRSSEFSTAREGRRAKQALSLFWQRHQ